MKKILVVDDDMDILFVIRVLLERHGFLVEQENHGERVISKVKKFEPGLILLDINLPGINGDEICEELKSNSSTKHIPIILFSAAMDLKSKYGHCEVDDFIEKPFEPKELVQTISKYF